MGTVRGGSSARALARVWALVCAGCAREGRLGEQWSARLCPPPHFLPPPRPHNPQKRLNLTKTVRKMPVTETLARAGAVLEDAKPHDPKYDDEHPVRLPALLASLLALPLPLSRGAAATCLLACVFACARGAAARRPLCPLARAPRPSSMHAITGLPVRGRQHLSAAHKAKF